MCWENLTTKIASFIPPCYGFLWNFRFPPNPWTTTGPIEKMQGILILWKHMGDKFPPNQTRGAYPGAFPWQQQPHTNPPLPAFFVGLPAPRSCEVDDLVHVETALCRNATWAYHLVEVSTTNGGTAESLPVAWLEHLKQTKKTLKVGERRNGYVIQNTNFSWGSKKKNIPQKLTKHLLKIKGWFRCKSQMNSSLFKGTFVHFRRGVTWQSHSLASANLPVTVCNNGWKFG